MRFRVHLFALVRVEHEVEAESPEDAAQQAFAADLDLQRRFDGPGQEYDGQTDEVCLVDPLTDEVGQDGRLIADEAWSQWLHVTEAQLPDSTKQTIVSPALFVPPSCFPAEEVGHAQPILGAIGSSSDRRSPHERDPLGLSLRDR